MKIRIFVSIMSFILIGFIIVGCATTGKITESVNEDSTLLIGRITVTCNNFPGSWHIKGDYKRMIEMDLQDVKSHKIITVKSKRSDGLLCVYDVHGKYAIRGFTYRVGGSTYRTTIGYRYSYPPIIDIKRGSVNNIGDIHWIETFEMITEKRGNRIEGKSSKELRFQKNYDQVKEWFQKTYPNSNWNSKSWINVKA